MSRIRASMAGRQSPYGAVKEMAPARTEAVSLGATNLHGGPVQILEPASNGSTGSESHGSTLQCVGYERVIRIAGIHKIDTGVAQQSFDLLDRSPNYTARLAGPNLALQLEEAPIGAVEALRQDRCNVKERDWVYPEYGGRIGDVKL